MLHDIGYRRFTMHTDGRKSQLEPGDIILSYNKSTAVCTTKPNQSEILDRYSKKRDQILESLLA